MNLVSDSSIVQFILNHKTEDEIGLKLFTCNFIDQLCISLIALITRLVLIYWYTKRSIWWNQGENSKDKEYIFQTEQQRIHKKRERFAVLRKYYYWLDTDSITD